MLTWESIQQLLKNGNYPPPYRVEKTDAQWKSLLTPEAYEITRHAATERAHSSEMCSKFEPGTYACICCKTVLFDGNQKYESGTGWPSFTQPLEDDCIAYHIDDSIPDRRRVETTCNICDAHLGHVFPDGPPPSGLRYCINAAALEKID